MELTNTEQTQEKVPVTDFISGDDIITIDNLLKVSNGNLLGYIGSKGWNRKKQQLFLDTYLYVIDGIKQGSIYRKENGALVDKNGVLNNSGHGFDSGGEVATYINEVMNAIPYEDESISSTNKYTDHANDFVNDIYNKIFGGASNFSEQGMQVWLDLDPRGANGKRAYTNRINAFLPYLHLYIASLDNTNYDYTGSAYKNVDDYKTALATLEMALSTGLYDNAALNAWMKAGLPISLGNALFNLGDVILQENLQLLTQSQLPAQTPIDARTIAIKKMMEENPGLSEEAAGIKYDDSLKEAEAQNQAVINEHNWLNYYDKTYANKPYIKRSINISEFDKNFDFDRTNSWFLTKLSSNARNTWYTWYNNLLKTPEKLLSVRNKGTLFLGSVLRLLLEKDAKQANSGQSNTMTRVGNTNKYILGVNYNDGTAYIYNRDTQTLNKIRVDLNSTPTLLALLKNHYMASKKKTTYNKQGGVLKALNGALLNLEYESKNAALKAQHLANIKNSGRTKELYEAGNKKVVKNGNLELDAIATARLAGAIMDVSSAIAAFAPGYGTAISGALSVGSMATEFGADIADKSVSKWDVVKNLGTNLAVGVAGLIPVVGSDGKLIKSAKTFVKYMPTLMAMYSTCAGADDAYKIYEKLRDGKDVTTDEWRELAYWIAGVSGVVRSGATTLKAKALDNASSETTRLDKITIKTNKGPKEITGTAKEKIVNAKTPEEANAALKELHPDAEIEYKRSMLQPWKKNKLQIEETHDSLYAIDTNLIRGLGTAGKTKFGLISDIDMLTGNGNITGFAKFNGAAGKVRGLLPSFDSLNPYNKKATTSGETVTKPIESVTPEEVVPTKGNNLKHPVGVKDSSGKAIRVSLEIPEGATVENIHGGLHRGNLTKDLIALLDKADPSWRLHRFNASEVQAINPEPTIPAKMAVIDKANNKVYIWKNGYRIPRFQNPSSPLYPLTYLDDNVDSYYVPEYDYEKLYGLRKQGDGTYSYGDAYQNRNSTGYNNGRYISEDIPGELNGKKMESLAAYKSFTEALIRSAKEYQKDASLGILFKNWANAVDKDLNNSPASFFDGDGNLRTSWSPNGLNSYNKSGNTYTSLSEYIKHIRNDLDFGTRHNDFRRIVKRYYDPAKSEDNKRAYVGLDNKSHYNEGKPEVKYDPDTGITYYDIPLTAKSNESPEGTTEGTDATDSSNNGTKKKDGEDGNNLKKNETVTNMLANMVQKKNILSRLSDFAKDPDNLATGRLLMNLRNNDKVAKETIKGIHPSLFSPIDKKYQIRGDLGSLMAYYQDANNTTSLGGSLALNMTDGNDAVAAMLQANANAEDMRSKGRQAYNQMVESTREKSWQVDNEVYDYNKKVQDTNNSAINAADKAIHDVKAAKMSSDLTNWNTYLEGKEYNMRNLLNLQLTFDKEIAEKEYETKMKNLTPKLKQLDNAYNEALKNYELILGDSSKSEAEKAAARKAVESAYNDYITEYLAFELDAYNAAQSKLALILGISYSPIVSTFDISDKGSDKRHNNSSEVAQKRLGGKLNELLYLKSGSDIQKARIKARSDDNKEFHKNIRHSQSLHLKSLDRLSKATLLAIKKAMNL